MGAGVIAGERESVGIRTARIRKKTLTHLGRFQALLTLWCSGASGLHASMKDKGKRDKQQLGPRYRIATYSAIHGIASVLQRRAPRECEKSPPLSRR
jgi:hypothetical protein